MTTTSTTPSYTISQIKSIATDNGYTVAHHGNSLSFMKGTKSHNFEIQGNRIVAIGGYNYITGKQTLAHAGLAKPLTTAILSFVA